jgi:hypothetical protein
MRVRYLRSMHRGARTGVRVSWRTSTGRACGLPCGGSRSHGQARPLLWGCQRVAFRTSRLSVPRISMGSIMSTIQSCSRSTLNTKLAFSIAYMLALMGNPYQTWSRTRSTLQRRQYHTLTHIPAALTRQRLLHHKCESHVARDHVRQRYDIAARAISDLPVLSLARATRT